MTLKYTLRKNIICQGNQSNVVPQFACLVTRRETEYPRGTTQAFWLSSSAMYATVRYSFILPLNTDLGSLFNGFCVDLGQNQRLLTTRVNS